MMTLSGDTPPSWARAGAVFRSTTPAAISAPTQYFACILRIRPCPPEVLGRGRPSGAACCSHSMGGPCFGEVSAM